MCYASSNNLSSCGTTEVKSCSSDCDKPHSRDKSGRLSCGHLLLGRPSPLPPQAATLRAFPFPAHLKHEVVHRHTPRVGTHENVHVYLPELQRVVLG